MMKTIKMLHNATFFFDDLVFDNPNINPRVSQYAPMLLTPTSKCAFNHLCDASVAALLRGMFRRKACLSLLGKVIKIRILRPSDMTGRKKTRLNVK